MNEWFAVNELPDPIAVHFFLGVEVPVEGLLLSTLTVTGNAAGDWTQPTNPVKFFDIPLDPIPLEPESHFYNVTVLPEPGTAMVIGLALAMVLRRKR